MDFYTELKGLPEMKGSLNTIVSDVYRLKRPPSLSESYVRTPENVERTRLNLLVVNEDYVIRVEEEAVAHIAVTVESRVVNTLLKFLFHIALISMFEGVFFFMYVSTLENSGIQKTVGGFVEGAVSACTTLSPFEKTIVDDLLNPLINATQIISQGSATASQRTIINTTLFNQSWMYVGGLSSLCFCVFMYALYRRLAIRYRVLILENIGLVCLLAIYEYTFFSTIIFPYRPISADEIAAGAVQQLQSVCGILVN